MNITDEKLDTLIEEAYSSMSDGRVRSEIDTATLAEVLAELRLHRRGEDIRTRITQRGVIPMALSLSRDVLATSLPYVTQDMKEAARNCILEANRMENEYYSQLCNSPYDYVSTQSLVDFSEMIDELISWAHDSKK